MKISIPAFGFISGLSEAFGFLPHILVLILLLITRMPLFVISLLARAMIAELSFLNLKK